MASKFWPKGGSPGVLHHYTETLVTFEFTSDDTPKPNSILFVGGLGDGLATTSYAADVVRSLQGSDWSFFTLTLTSSYQAWGLGHLDRDTDEIALCIQYIKEFKTAKFGGDPGKFVLMGHSTGSQCVLHYLYRSNPHTGSPPAFDPDLKHVQRPVLDGAIMQAPISDREAILWVLHEGMGGKSPAELRDVYDRLVAKAKEALRKDEKCDTLLPLSMTPQIGYPPNTPLSSRRFLSLVSPDSPASPGDDDLFSSDLSDEQFTKTFGMIRSRGLLKHKLMVLYSGADQAVPDWVDKEKLLSRWRRAADGNGKDPVWHPESGIIPGASHALSNDDQAGPRRILVGKVMRYLAGIKGGE